MRRITVLHLMGSLRPSGMERMLVSAAPYFNSLGISGIVVGQGPTHPFAPDLEAAGYGVLTIPSLRSFSGMSAYSQLLKLHSPDIVHIHSESAFAVSTLLSKFIGRMPLVRTVHNVFTPRGRSRYSRKFQAIVADRNISQFICPSSDVACNERNFGRSPRTIMNWVADEYSSISSVGDPMSAVLVGNCSPVKNHELALRALVKNGYSVAHHGDEQDASDEEVKLLDALADGGKLLARGTTPPLDSLKRAGVFVMPSLHEGMPVAFAEALSMNVPCLVSDSPGLAWSKETVGVEHLPLDQERWEAALPSSGYVPAKGSRPSPDFRARRGANDYANVYFSLLTFPGAVYPTSGEVQ